MPKQSPTETPGLRRSARIKNVKTPPIYNIGSPTLETRKRKSTSRRSRVSTEGSERRKPLKKRSSFADSGLKRTSAKRKKISSQIDEEITNETLSSNEASHSVSEIEEKPVETSVSPIKPDVSIIQEEETHESSVSMIVNVPSLLESGSMHDDSECDLKASIASILDQNTTKKSESLIETNEVTLSEDACVTVESDQLSQNGIFANVSVLTGEERVFGKNNINSKLCQQLKGINDGAFVLSSKSGNMDRKDVITVLSYDCQNDELKTVENTLKMCEADVILLQNVSTDIEETLKMTFTQVIDGFDQYLQVYLRNGITINNFHLVTSKEILMEISPLLVDTSQAFYNKMSELSQCFYQAFTIVTPSGEDFTIINSYINSHILDVASIELASMIIFAKKRYTNFAIAGNWTAFPANNEDYGSLLQILLGKPEQSTLFASIPLPQKVTMNDGEHKMISCFAPIFDLIEHGFMSNFADEDRPASDIWTAGLLKVVAAWQKSNRGRSPSLVAIGAITSLSEEEIDEEMSFPKDDIVQE